MSAETLPLLHSSSMASAATGTGSTNLVFTPLDDIPRICEDARRVFNTGRTKSLEWRLSQLRGIQRLAREQGDAIAAALHTDLRRPQLESVVYETAVIQAEADHAISHLSAWAGARSVETPTALLPAKSYVKPEPVGVVLVVAPWNFPIMLVLAPLVAVLAAGNTVVIKPSELAPASAVFLQQVLHRYLDPEAVKIIQGGVDETTRVLAQRFDHILYTGGGAVAQHVMRAAATHLTPVTLELGGKCPVIIDKDADLALAAKRVMSGKINAGQACISPDYVLVHRDVEDRFIELASRTLREFFGEDTKRSSDIGRIINRRHFARVQNLIQTSGGKVVAGGDTDVAELYIAPTIIREPSRDAPIMQEEIFGPVLPVLGVSNVDEAIEYVNAHAKPLAAYVFASSSSTIKRVIDNTSSGGVTVNDVLMHCGNPDLPFGGVGASGMGAYHGQWGFDRFSHMKAVLEMPTFLDPGKFRYPPYTERKTRMLASLLTGLPRLPRPSFKDVLIVGLAVAVVVLSVKYSQK